MKRFRRIILTTLTVFLVLAGSFAFWIYLTGGRELQSWIGHEIRDVANTYLVPRLDFDDVRFRYPYTVTLYNVRLTADDPREPGMSIDVIACEEATLTLARVPRYGQPLQIKSISLTAPEISAVSIEPKSGRLVGFSNLIRKREEQQQRKPSDKPARKLSDYFNIKLIELRDGRITYDPRIADTVPMVLDQISTTLNVEPNAQGEYGVSFDIARDEIFDFKVYTRLNLDTLEMNDLWGKLGAALSEENLANLPPQIQTLLKKYEVRGKFWFEFQGKVPIQKTADTSLLVNVGLYNAEATVGDFHIPIKQIEAEAAVGKGQVRLSSLKMDALGGRLDAAAVVTLDSFLNGEFSINVAHMDIEQLMAAKAKGKPSTLVGKLNASVHASAPMMIVAAKAGLLPTPPPGSATQATTNPTMLAALTLPEKWGEGVAELGETQLVQLPVLHQLNDLVRSTFSGLSGSSPPPRDERLTVNFDFSRDGVRVLSMNYLGGLVAARGSGMIYLDRKLDLRVNAGPLEKIQSVLGVFGNAFGRLTDAFGYYHVTGTMNAPAVRPALGPR